MDVQTITFPIETEHLTLRLWCEADRGSFTDLCADPRVMEFLTPQPTRAASDAYIDRILAHHEQHGFGYLVIEERETGAFVGVTGLRYVPFEAHFTPAVEFGWRMPVAFWGKGFATEAPLDFIPDQKSGYYHEGH